MKSKNSDSMSSKVTGAKVRSDFLIKCPTCGKSVVYGVSNPNRPFCSLACQNGDLAAWASETYRVPDNQASNDEGHLEVQMSDDENHG